MKHIFSLIILLSLSTIVRGQSGVQFMSGISFAYNENAAITPKGENLPGYLIGADAVLNGGKMFFVIGLQYKQMAFDVNAKNSFFNNDPQMTWLKARFGLGFHVIEFSEKIKLRSKLMASINSLLSYPESYFSEPYHIFNSSVGGVVLGIGLDLGKFTIDFEYDKGFFNAVNKVENSKMDFVNLAIGFRI